MRMAGACMLASILASSVTAHAETDVFMRTVGFALTGSDDADASDKLSKLDKSWRSQRAGALPHCGMPSRLKTRLGQLCQTEYLPSTGRHI